jgi:hypothetical protein
MTDPAAERFLTAEQVAAWLTERGVPTKPNAVRSQLAHGQLPGRKVGKAWVVSLAALRRWFGIADASLIQTPCLARRKTS